MIWWLPFNDRDLMNVWRGGRESKVQNLSQDWYDLVKSDTMTRAKFSILLNGEVNQPTWRWLDYRDNLCDDSGTALRWCRDWLILVLKSIMAWCLFGTLCSPLGIWAENERRAVETREEKKEVWTWRRLKERLVACLWGPFCYCYFYFIRIHGNGYLCNNG